jgi:hypothetical protein
LSEVGRVHAVLIGYDRYWLWLYSLAAALGPRFYALDGAIEPFADEYLDIEAPTEIDREWRCHSWDNHVGTGDPSPIVIEVRRIGPRRVPKLDGIPILGSERYFNRQVTRQIEQQVLDLGPSIPGIAGARVQVQNAPLPRLNAGSSSSGRIWQSSRDQFGTLGGVLHVKKFGYCVTTAGHVAPTVGDEVFAEIGGTRRKLGLCVHAPDYAKGLKDETSLIAVDEATAKQLVAEGSKVGLFTPSDYGPGQSLTVRGVRSAGTVVCPDHYARFVTVQGDTERILVNDGVDLRRTEASPWGPRNLRPTEPGDSGAWLLRGPAWCGSVVGGNAVSSVATFASNTVKAFKKSYGEIRLV